MPNNRFPSGDDSQKVAARKAKKDKRLLENPKAPHNLVTILGKAGFTREMVETKVADILLMDSEETRKMKNDPKASNFDLIVIAVAEAAQRNADTNRLDNLLDKIFGKVVRIDGKIQLDSTNVNMNIPLSNIDGDLITRAMDRALRGNV